MFEMIRRWMSFASSPSASQQIAFQKLNEVAPLKSAQAETAAQGQVSYLCREAVLNRDERISGYLFTMRQRLSSRMMGRSMMAQRVHDTAMLNSIAMLDVLTLLGHRNAFIHLSPSSLNNPLLNKFSRRNVVVMITADTLMPEDFKSLPDNLQRLGEIGVKYGWTLSRSHPEIREFLPGADFIEIESTSFDGAQLKLLFHEYHTISGELNLIVSGLQSSEEFRLCYHSGFHQFMGPFVSSRENWHPPKSEINRIRIIEVLNMIRRGAEFGVIADALKTESVLTFKLLRYINSPGVGLLQKISDISQALMVLGRDQFYRWLSMMLFDFDHTGYHERVLNEQVLARARFMESIAGQGRVPSEADQLFLIGLFSMLDVMMDKPLNEILKQISLPDPVLAALKGEPGSMRDALLLAIAVESGTTDEIAAAALRCGLDAEAVTGRMIEALAWAQQASAAGQ